MQSPSDAGPEPTTVEVRFFGLLRRWCEDNGVPNTLSVSVPEDGATAREVAERLGLPPDAIEGVFVNHTLFDLDHEVRPGDRIAFVPYGTPGPHRLFLGLYEAGRESRDHEHSSADTSGDEDKPGSKGA